MRSLATPCMWCLKPSPHEVAVPRRGTLGEMGGRNARVLALLSGGRVCATDMEEALGGSWPTDAW